jgi:circadian clock protein KaiC
VSGKLIIIDFINLKKQKYIRRLKRMKKKETEFQRKSLPKSLTSIQGFDEITGGGLPKGRPTLVCGGPGCGKTLFAMEFLVRGAMVYNEPGVFISFEETEKELTANVASL